MRDVRGRVRTYLRTLINVAAGETKMKPVKMKIIQESRKARTYYVISMLIAMVISVGGLFLAKTGHGGAQMFPDSFRSISLITVVGWVLGLCGVMAAAVISRRSKGVFILTGESVAYNGITPEDHWDQQNTSIRDCARVNSWFEKLMGCSRILLAIDNPVGSENRVEVGPFSKKVAESWMTELKKIIGGSAQPAVNSKKTASSA
jgi:hypothetical protein